MNSKSRGLGKGLDALFNQSNDSSPVEETEQQYQLLPIDDIQPNPMQPRKSHSPEALEELSRSIQDQGLLQPILVRILENQTPKHQIIAGERRWRACQNCGHREIPALVVNLSNTETMIFGLIENLQREDLNPVEEAEALYHLYDEFQLSQDDIAQKIGRSRSSIANSLRLLQLEPKIRESVRSEKISSGQARTLLGIDDSQARLQVLERLLSHPLTVRELEKVVAYWKEHSELPGSFQAKHSGKADNAKQEFEPLKKQLKNSIASRFGANVQIRGEKGKGRISFVYNSESELLNILEQLGINDPSVSRET